MKKNTILILLFPLLIIACRNDKNNQSTSKNDKDSIATLQEEDKPNKIITAKDIKIIKEITFDKYTLEDKYDYKDTFRVFQWEKIKEQLAYIENFQKEHNQYAVISNYKNKNGEAPTVENFKRNAYKRVSDTLGTERYQSVPLYQDENTKLPSIYGRDGSLVKLLSSDTTKMVKVKGLTNFEGDWFIPKRYIKNIGDTVSFKHAVVIDVTNQNICALDHQGDTWYVRSMNPATTGKHSPPYAMETPVGIFLVQEQKSKMFYFGDGTKTIEGFAPWASRFTNGAYVHGVPVNNPKGAIIEYSSTLGTTPRSHMCVRNASSHAKFVYDWIKPYQSLVIVID